MRGDCLRLRRASNRLISPVALMAKVSAGHFQEAGTQLGAARWTMRSGLIWARHPWSETMSLRSASQSSILSRMGRIFSIRLRQRTIPKTSTPGCRARMYSARWLPAKPGIPVIRTLIRPPLSLFVVAVVGIVERLEFGAAVLDFAPPGLVIAIPEDGRSEGLVELCPGLPAEAADLGAVEGIAAVVAEAVGHKLDQASGFVQQVADPLSDVDVADL